VRIVLSILDDEHDAVNDEAGPDEQGEDAQRQGRTDDEERKDVEDLRIPPGTGWSGWSATVVGSTASG